MDTEELVINGKRRIAEVGEWDYAWSVYAVFVDEAGRLYSVAQHGCSCFSPYENEQDLEWNRLDNIQAAIKESREWVTGEKKDIEDFVADLMAYKPDTAQ